MTGSIDKLLEDFGDEIDPIYSRGRHVKEPKRSGKTASKLQRSTGPATRESRRATLERIARKSPEVMVKITGGGRNIIQIKRHMDYISRNGLVELEDEQGLIYSGKQDVRLVRDAWRDGGHPVPNNGEDGPREAFNVMLSMPEGTDRAAVKDAARAFAAAEFKGFQYAFAAHDDTMKPHVHITVKATALDGTRLNPRKGDLHRWRVAFAQELRDRGIDANASPRKARGIVRKGQRQALRGIAERGGRSNVLRQQQAQALREARGGRPHTNPAQDKISANRSKSISMYGTLAKELAKGDEADKRLALQIVDLVKDMPPLTTAHESRVQAARANIAEAVQEGRTTGRAPEPERDDKGRA